ncbi:MAG: branched-chain amino acid ABC transporter permease [Actinobacteria bacterium]|nr:branched-chain amino acid ABC transporter permease [Actinomycetota bacterium]
MQQFMSALLLGLIGGAPFALLGLGLVLVYRGSRVFNFAQGEFGTVSAFTAYLLSFRLPIGISMLIGIGVGVLMGLLTERLVVQPLFNAPKVTLLVATAAVATGSIALQLAIGDAALRSYPPLIEGNAFEPFNVPIRWQQLLVVLALAGVAIALYLFFKTALGTAVLAAAQEPVATDLVGIGTRKMSALVWGLAGLVGGITGVIVAALQPFTPGYVTSDFLIFAFVAAVVGGMTSMPGAVLGGLVLGLVQSFSASYLADIRWISDNIPAVGEVTVFILLIAVLAFRPTGLLGKEA